MTHFSFGDDGWQVSVTPVQAGPDRLYRYKNRTAQATFSFPPAEGVLNPEKLSQGAGTIRLFALTHLALARLGQLPKQTITLDSEQVSKLAGVPLPQAREPEMEGQTDALAQVIA